MDTNCSGQIIIGSKSCNRCFFDILSFSLRQGELYYRPNQRATGGERITYL